MNPKTINFLEKWGLEICFMILLIGLVIKFKMIKFILILFGVPAMISAIITAILTDIGWQSVALILGGLFTLANTIILMIDKKRQKNEAKEIKAQVNEAKIEATTNSTKNAEKIDAVKDEVVTAKSEIEKMHQQINSNQKEQMAAIAKASQKEGIEIQKEVQKEKETNIAEGVVKEQTAQADRDSSPQIILPKQ